MKKTSTHDLLHTVENAGGIPDGEDPFGEEQNVNTHDIDPGKILNRLQLKVPETTMQRLFLRIRIATLRNRN